MPPKNKPARKVRPKESKKTHASKPCPRQRTGCKAKTYPPKKGSGHHGQKANIDAHVSAGSKFENPKTTTASVSHHPNPDGNKASSSHANKCQEKASFLLLPPEIRLQIYQELFHPHRVEILRRKNNSHGSPKSALYRLCYHEVVPRDAQSQRISKSEEILTSTPLPAPLIFTCKLIYCETIHLLYSTTQFIFRCTKTTARFLKTTSKDSQSAIHHVELHHIMYNEPRLTEFREYKLRSDRAWYMVCDEMSQNFKDLRAVYVDMTVHDWPIHMEIGERWSFPLLLFGEHGHLLDFAQIRLHMPRFSNEKLRSVARSVEERIMKPDSFQIREDEILARKLMGPVKARKILELSF